MAETEITLGKLGKTFTGLSGKTKEDFGFGKPYIPYINIFRNSKINPGHLEYVNIKKGEKQNQVRYGDILFTTSSETIEEVGMTSVLLDEIGEAYLNSFCFGFRLNNFDILLPEFARYLLRSEELRHKISLKGQGSTRYNLSKTELLNNLILRIPSKENQIAIARILSTADRAIAQTEALIAKYQRIKTGLLQDLLTKGIDAKGNIRSKATHRFVVKAGVEVPEEWEVGTLGKLAKFNSGYAFKFEQLSESGYKVVRISNLHKSDFPYWYYNGLIKMHWLAKDGDILFTWAGVASSIDCIKYQGEDVLLNQHIYNFIFNSELVKQFSYWYLQFFLPKLRQEIEGGAGQLHLTKDKIQAIKIPLMNQFEMEQIVSRLFSIDDLVNKSNNQLEKLTSFKKGLMQDLLSGKVSLM